jgi:hypothetical protein
MRRGPSIAALLLLLLLLLLVAMLARPGHHGAALLLLEARVQLLVDSGCCHRLPASAQRLQVGLLLELHGICLQEGHTKRE